MDWVHFKYEYDPEFTSILYIPKKAPAGFFDNYGSKSNSLKLYVRGVLINEEFEDLMPRYLNFIKGVVFSDDLPLNVNRENIQEAIKLDLMSIMLVRKALDELIYKMAIGEHDDHFSE